MTLRFKKKCDCRQEDAYDAGCPRCIGDARAAGSCLCTCREMHLKSEAKAQYESVEDCKCITGTTAPGGLPSGIFFGWAYWDDPEMLRMRERAALKQPDDPRIKVTLWGNGAAGGPDPHCSVGTSGWTQLPMNVSGDMELFDPAGGPIVEGSGSIISAATQITAEQFGLEIDPVEGGEGTDCAQTGGHRDIKIIFTTVDGQLLAECLFPGVTGRPPCENVTCCDWHITGTSESGCTDGSSTPGVFVQRAETCEFVPTASVIFTVDGVETEYGVNPDLSSVFIQHTLSCPTVSGTVTARLVQSYGDGAPCPTPADEEEEFES